MFRRRFLPEREVVTVAFLGLSVQFACLGDNVVEVAAGQFAVVVISAVFLHIEIDRAVDHIRVAVVQNLLDESNLLDDMSRSVRLDRRRQHAQCFHIAVVAVGVVLHHFHRFELLQTRFLGYLVLAFVSVVLEVTYIGDIAHITHFVPEISQVSEQHIERDRGSCVAQMSVTIDGRSAHVEPYVRGVKRLKRLLRARECIIKV